MFSVFQIKYVTHASTKKTKNNEDIRIVPIQSHVQHVKTDEPQAWKFHQLDVYKKIASIAFQVTKMFGCIFNDAKLKHTQTRHISTEGFKSRDRGKNKKRKRSLTGISWLLWS